MSKYDECAEAFMDRKVFVAGGMVTTPDVVYSYGLKIAESDGDRVLVYDRSLIDSMSTKTHVKAIIRALEAAGYQHVPQGDAGEWHWYGSPEWDEREKANREAWSRE